MDALDGLWVAWAPIIAAFAVVGFWPDEDDK